MVQVLGLTIENFLSGENFVQNIVSNVIAKVFFSVDKTDVCTLTQTKLSSALIQYVILIIHVHLGMLV